MNASERLDADSISRRLRTAVIGRNIAAYDRISSTQDAAFELAASSTSNPDGTLVIAEYQTKGRGRHDRRWIAPPYRNLLFSLILSPRARIARPSLLTFAAGLAAAEAVEDETGWACRLKWPNDVLMNGRKLCGILTESGERPNGKPFWIVGVGVNVNLDEEDFPRELAATATSIQAETRTETNRAALLGRMLERFEERYGALQRGESEELLAAARRRSWTLGNAVLIRADGNDLEGVAFEFDDDGALLVRTPLGRVYRVTDADDTRVLADGPFGHRHG